MKKRRGHGNWSFWDTYLAIYRLMHKYIQFYIEANEIDNVTRGYIGQYLYCYLGHSIALLNNYYADLYRLCFERYLQTEDQR